MIRSFAFKIEGMNFEGFNHYFDTNISLFIYVG